MSRTTNALADSALGLVVQLIALRAAPQVLALAVGPLVHWSWVPRAMGVIVLPLVVVTLLFATGRAIANRAHGAPLLVSYAVASLVLAVAAVYATEPSEAEAAALVADTLAGPLALVAGVLLIRPSERSARAEAGAITLVLGISGLFALPLQTFDWIRNSLHATTPLSAWIGGGSGTVARLAVYVLALRAARHLLSKSGRARSALLAFVVVEVLVEVASRIVTGVELLLDDTYRSSLEMWLPQYVSGFVGIAIPLVIWFHARRDMREVPPRLAAPPIAWIAWWIAPVLLARAAVFATDEQHFVLFVLLVVQGLCNAIAASAVLRGVRWAPIAAGVAAANAAALIGMIVREWIDAELRLDVPWWSMFLLLVTNALLIVLSVSGSRGIRFHPHLARPDERD